MKQKIKQTLIKFLGIDELEHLVEANEEILQEVKELSESNEYELNEKPSFYDMESQVEELVEDNMKDLIERIEALEEA